MKKNGSDFGWLPPPEEWDFRSVGEKECALACCWEYARNVPRICARYYEWAHCGKRRRTHLAFLFGPILDLSIEFPAPWLTCLETTRLEVANLFVRHPVEITEMHWLKKDLPRDWYQPMDFRAMIDGGTFDFTIPRHVVMRLFRDLDGCKRSRSMKCLPSYGCYVLRVNFAPDGVEAVIREFAKWARKEAKNFARRKLAKAAEPPFDCLKWLSALRLEAARKKAGLNFEDVQKALRQYRDRYPVRSHSDVLPFYASRGAWCKARGDAEKLVRLLESDLVAFEKRVFVF